MSNKDKIFIQGDFDTNDVPSDKSNPNEHDVSKDMSSVIPVDVDEHGHFIGGLSLSESNEEKSGELAIADENSDADLSQQRISSLFKIDEESLEREIEKYKGNEKELDEIYNAARRAIISSDPLIRERAEMILSIVSKFFK